MDYSKKDEKLGNLFRSIYTLGTILIEGIRGENADSNDVRHVGLEGSTCTWPKYKHDEFFGIDT